MKTTGLFTQFIWWWVMAGLWQTAPTSVAGPRDLTSVCGSETRERKMQKLACPESWASNAGGVHVWRGIGDRKQARSTVRGEAVDGKGRPDTSNWEHKFSHRNLNKYLGKLPAWSGCPKEDLTLSREYTRRQKRVFRLAPNFSLREQSSMWKRRSVAYSQKATTKHGCGRTKRCNFRDKQWRGH